MLKERAGRARTPPQTKEPARREILEKARPGPDLARSKKPKVRQAIPARINPVVEAKPEINPRSNLVAKTKPNNLEAQTKKGK